MKERAVRRRGGRVEDLAHDRVAERVGTAACLEQAETNPDIEILEQPDRVGSRHRGKDIKDNISDSSRNASAARA